MSSAASLPEEPASSRPAETTESSSHERTNQEVLEWVLEETARSDGTGTAFLLPAVRQIALRHARQTLSLDPITVELVNAVLHCRFQKRLKSPDLLKRMSRTIAETLWRDPVTYHRLLAFWARLNEVSSKR
jgi:hypothetical protein